MLLSGIRSQFDLNDGFLYFANEVLYRYFDVFKNKKDSVIAGLITEFVKREMKRNDIIVSRVCYWLGINPSVISNNIEIFKKLIGECEQKG